MQNHNYLIVGDSMNYYMARQRQDNKFWNWTLHRDDWVYPAGACADGNCKHETKHDAEMHEARRVAQLIREAYKFPIETNIGKKCQVPYCTGQAFKTAVVGLILYIACDDHFENPERLAYSNWCAST